MFPLTRLSVVARARSDDDETRQIARAALVEAYWKPVYKYLRLSWRLSPDAAADATQDFFVSVIERDLVARYQPHRSRFRTYLRLCLDAFAGNRLKAERRMKRGGGQALLSLDFSSAEGELVRLEPAVPADLDELFYQEWVRALFERTVAELRSRANADGRSVPLEVFSQYDLSDAANARPSYALIAERLGLTTSTVTNHLAAMRREFRAIVLDLLRETTGSHEEWEAEARRLLGGGW